jgi:arylsulfatase A
MTAHDRFFSSDPQMIGRRSFIKTTGVIMAGAALSSQLQWAMAAEQPPNIVFIFCDDLGYGDIGSFGSSIPTPNIDSIAKEGVRFTHFSASPLCSPSRAGLMTGRYATRVNVPRVLMSSSEGLDLSETTVANVLKSRGYSTMCIGKWHLGDLPEYLPTSRGFDEYYGIPYSNDISPVKLMHNTETIEFPVIQATLTKRYTEQALKFIERSKDRPFFLYMPHTFPHTPLAASEQFIGKSGMGLYADSIMEIDWSVGEILNTLKRYGLEKNTLVIFTSDNGPANGEGSAGGLRGRKGTTYEGGVRVPFAARLPGQIPSGLVCSGVTAAIDMLPTLAALTGAELPSRTLDGINIWPLFTGKQKQMKREVLLYWEAWTLTAARLGNWKLRFAQSTTGMAGGLPMGGQPSSAPGGGQPGSASAGGTQVAGAGAGKAENPSEGWQAVGGSMGHSGSLPALYNLETDPDESYNAAAAHPDIVADITAHVERLVPGFPEEVQKAWAETMAKWTASDSAARQ